MSILNCNPVDGNLITERTAVSIYFGEQCSIEDAYCKARRNKDGNIAGVNDFDHLLIKGVVMPIEDAGYFYEALWFMFLADNKDIYTKLMSFSDFEDGKGDKSMNSAARVFRILKKGGLTGLKTHCKAFLERYDKKAKESPKPEANSDISKMSFNELDNIARHLVKFNYKAMNKKEILDEARALESDILVKLTDLRYDEYSKVITQIYFKNIYQNLKREFDNRQLTPTSDDSII